MGKKGYKEKPNLFYDFLIASPILNGICKTAFQKHAIILSYYFATKLATWRYYQIGLFYTACLSVLVPIKVHVMLYSTFHFTILEWFLYCSKCLESGQFNS